MSKAIELADNIVALWDNGVFERGDASDCSDELRRLAGVEKQLEAAQAELAAIRALEPVAWAYVDMWKAQDDPVDDCFFIYDRKGTTPLYALPEQK